MIEIMTPQKYYIQMFSVHGLLRAENMQLAEIFGTPFVYTGHCEHTAER